jgi:hypothetical protein
VVILVKGEQHTGMNEPLTEVSALLREARFLQDAAQSLAPELQAALERNDRATYIELRARARQHQAQAWKLLDQVMQLRQDE